MANEYDVVVIGAGTGGYVAAIRAAQLGLKVAVVEKQKALGGTCLIWGCIPTKALLEHAHALKIAQAAKEWGLTGIDGAAVSIDMPAVHARKDKMIAGLTGGIEMLFKKNKIEWIKGTARLTGGLGSSVEVTLHDGTKQSLAAPKEIIVATGSSPRSVPGIEADRKKIIFSDEAIHLPAVPKSIAHHGQRRRRRRVRVDLQELRQRSDGDRAAAAAGARRRRSGVGRARARVQEARHQGDDRLEGDLRRSRSQGRRHRGASRRPFDPSRASGRPEQSRGTTGSGQGGKSQKLNFELLLVATGRGPVTEGLGAEKLGLKMDRGYIVVDQMFKTSVPGISAIGDVITMGGPHYQLAHVSSMEGIVLAERIAGHAVQPINYDHVPRCTYTEPEIGSVGLTEAQAKAQGHDVRVGSRSRSARWRAPAWPAKSTAS